MNLSPLLAQEDAKLPEAPQISIDPLIDGVNAFLAKVGDLPPTTLALQSGLSLLVVAGAALIMWLLGRLLNAAVKRFAPHAGEAEGGKKRVRIGGSALAIARAALVVTAIFLVLKAWGVDVVALTGGVLGPFFDFAWRLALILVIAFGVVEVSNIALAGVIERAAARAQEPRRAAQLRTILPILRGAVSVVVFVIAAISVLSEIGVDVAPLIAGAGVVGLAVGFGAQTIVKDLITGLFLIMEDIVSIGDIVDIQNTGGVVENMTLRTIRLRSFDGTLHVYPYSEAQVIHNKTKDFSSYAFDLSISYSSDINKALEQMKKVGAELKEDAAFGNLMMEPIEIFGVDQLADSGVRLKARIKTRPGQQWTIGREYLKRIKLAFDAAGVEIPFPHVKLVAPDRPIFERVVPESEAGG